MFTLIHHSDGETSGYPAVLLVRRQFHHPSLMGRVKQEAVTVLGRGQVEPCAAGFDHSWEVGTVGSVGGSPTQFSSHEQPSRLELQPLKKARRVCLRKNRN